LFAVEPIHKAEIAWIKCGHIFGRAKLRETTLTYQMECRCGAANCRRVVTGQDWRRKELQKKYSGFFSWYLQKKIEG